jgi:hypothetical protein
VRVHDLDLQRRQLLVRHGKDRVVMLPRSLEPELAATSAPGPLFTALDRASRGRRLSGTGLYLVIRGSRARGRHLI